MIEFALGVMTGASCFWGGLAALRGREKKVVAAHPNEPVVQLVIDLLAEEGWTRERYNLVHPTGCSIWIGNEAYGLNIAIDGYHAGPYSSSRGTGIETTDEQRQRVWRAIRSSERLGVPAEAMTFASNVIAFKQRAAA